MKHKFLISSCCGLGNFIQKTPMIKTLYEIFPEANIDAIVCEETNNPLFKNSIDNIENVFKNSKYIKNKIYYKNNKSIIAIIKFALEIRKENYQYIFFY